MRRALVLILSALPALAQAAQDRHASPATAHIELASVTFGPGIVRDRSGEAPPAERFQPKLNGEVKIDGLPSGARPRFRFWLAAKDQEERLGKLSPRAAGARALPAPEGAKVEDGRLRFSLPWAKSEVAEADRLFVEIFVGRRRVATAFSPIQAQYLPASRPRDAEENN